VRYIYIAMIVASLLGVLIFEEITLQEGLTYTAIAIVAVIMLKNLGVWATFGVLILITLIRSCYYS